MTITRYMTEMPNSGYICSQVRFMMPWAACTSSLPPMTVSSEVSFGIHTAAGLIVSWLQVYLADTAPWHKKAAKAKTPHPVAAGQGDLFLQKLYKPVDDEAARRAGTAGKMACIQGMTGIKKNLCTNGVHPAPLERSILPADMLVLLHDTK